MSKAEESSKKRSRRNLNFSTDEVSALIQVWGSPEIQRKFSLGLTRHTILYQEISAFMNAMGFDREADALQTKIANLKSKFYVEKNTSSKSGSSPSSWIHYDDMNRVLGSRPLANDGCVSDSLRTTVEDDPLLGISEIEEYLLLGDGTDDNTGCSTSLPSGSSNSDASSSSISLDTMPRQAKNTFVVRKTKRGQSDNTLLHKLLENDDKLIKLTEKRMKLEEESRIKHNNMLDAATNFFNSFAQGPTCNFPNFTNTQASSTKSVPVLLPTVNEFPKQTSRLAVPATHTKPPHTVPAPVKPGTSSTKSVPLLLPTVNEFPKQTSRLAVPATHTKPPHTVPAPVKPGTSSTKSVPLLLPTVNEFPKQTSRLAVPATHTKPPHTVPAPVKPGTSSTKYVPLLLPTVNEFPKQTFRLAVPATHTKPPHTVPAPVKPGTVVHIKPSPSPLAPGRVQKPIIFKSTGITFSKSSSDI